MACYALTNWATESLGNSLAEFEYLGRAAMHEADTKWACLMGEGVVSAKQEVWENCPCCPHPPSVALALGIAMGIPCTADHFSKSMGTLYTADKHLADLNNCGYKTVYNSEGEVPRKSTSYTLEKQNKHTPTTTTSTKTKTEGKRWYGPRFCN